MIHIKPYKLFENKLGEVPKTWFHGTNKLFDKFDDTYRNVNFKSSILGFYFSQHRKPPPYSSTAEEYAKDAVGRSGGIPVVYECELDIKKPLVLNSEGWYSSNAYLDVNRNDIKRWLNNDSYDGILCYDQSQMDIMDMDYIAIVFDSEQIDIIKTHQL